MDAQKWIDPKASYGKRVLPPDGPAWIGDPKGPGFPVTRVETAAGQ